MSEPRLRCRYSVWERGRGMSNYQCWNAAKTTRPLDVRGSREELPVCGVHARAVDRDPTAWMHSAYWWDGSPYSAKVQETKA
jgi:hypothetical protein